jgi:hypothetical protein
LTLKTVVYIVQKKMKYHIFSVLKCLCLNENTVWTITLHDNKATLIFDPSRATERTICLIKKINRIIYIIFFY